MALSKCRCVLLASLASIVVFCGYFVSCDGLAIGPGINEQSWAAADFRILDTALESYYIDHKQYPPMLPYGERLKAAGKKPLPPALSRLNAIPPRALPLGFEVLEKPGQTFFAYHSDERGWILVGRGPDGDFDVRNPAALYQCEMEKARLPEWRALLAYDPTNGAKSSGDVWRVKE